MTHTTVDDEHVNSGSHRTVFHTIDVSSLDNAGSEGYDPAAETAVDVVLGVSVAGQEDESLFVRYDHVAGNLSVTSAADGTDTTAGTDVGEIILRVDGDPGA
ncbi:hypothetical protein [Haloarcula sebkhae]|uniref:Uncharacterized protein n=2 Tax=Haloarcula sebkhae TaxID=932660 RepID=A0ACC6VIT4_9EURY|nr:hypothetical protein [Haloarcula sebkhae]GGK74566.1 hypothetical protein GCM10009067_28470 [Haloarcula sebkhae]